MFILQAKPFSSAATNVRTGRGALLLRGQAPLRRLFTWDYAAFVASSPHLRPQRHPAGGPFSTATTIVLHRCASLALKSRINARIRLFPRVSLHRFPSLGLKSRINAQIRLFPRKTLHRFPSLALKSRITLAASPFCRRNHSPLPQRRIESDADLVAATTAAGETILLCVNEKQNRTRTSLPLRSLQAEPFSFAATKIRICRGSSLPRRALQAGNSSLQLRWCCSDSQIHPIKSRITAVQDAFPGKKLHRFASLGMKSRIDARKRA